MHAPPESIEIFVLCNAIFSLREKFVSKMFDPAIVIFMPIYVYVSSSTSAAGSGSPYFVFFFLDISCRYTLFLGKYHKNSYEISEQMSKSGFFPMADRILVAMGFQEKSGKSRRDRENTAEFLPDRGIAEHFREMPCTTISVKGPKGAKKDKKPVTKRT